MSLRSSGGPGLHFWSAYICRYLLLSVGLSLIYSHLNAECIQYSNHSRSVLPEIQIYLLDFDYMVASGYLTYQS